VGSARIIRANGGQFDGEITSSHSGKAVSRFWIMLDPQLAARDVRPAGGASEKCLDELTLFVTRGPELLLLESNGTAGLPTGIVNRDESFSNAAWRTLFSQTGLARPRLNAILEQRATLLGDDLRFLLSTGGLTHLPDGRTLSGRLRRGTPVSILARQGPFAQVTFSDYTVDTRGQQRVRSRMSGWLPAPLLADVHTRHFLHLTDRDGGPTTWHHRTAEQRLRFFWARPGNLPSLLPQHARWLEEFGADLLPG
jgi:hypothetical protein